MLNHELSFVEISDILLEIISGERISNLEYCIDPVIFTMPTGRQKNYFNFVEKKAITRYIEDGFISENSAEDNEAFMDSFFSVEEQEILEEIQKKIKGYKQILKKKNKKLPSYAEDHKKLVELETEEQELLNKKNSINLFSAEYKAREEKFLRLMAECTLNLNRERVFPSIEDLDSTVYSMNMLYLDLNKYLDFYFGYDTNFVRQVARSSQWKNLITVVDKNYINLFNTTAENLSFDQLNLISWSSYYITVYDMSLKDRPSEDIINDDDKLDEYLLEYSKKVRAEVELSKTSNNPNKQDHVVITADSPDYIRYQKDKLYSDTAIISGKSKEGSNEFNEAKEFKKIKQKINSR